MQNQSRYFNSQVAWLTWDFRSKATLLSWEKRYIKFKLIMLADASGGTFMI